MNFDVNTLRIAVTVAGLVLFLWLVVHSYSKKRRSEHEAAAMLPFQEEMRPQQENPRE
jgi:cbb3-type cytochrome oxidase subunit 3